MPRPQRKDVEIFNFSFLDILACTIGALTFILVLVVITNLNETIADADIQELRAQIEQMEARRVEASRLNETLTAQVDQLQRESASLEQQIETSQARIADARQKEQEARTQLQESKQQAEEARSTIATLRPQNQVLANLVQELNTKELALAAQVEAARETVKRISAEFQQLEQGVIDQAALIEQREKLEADNEQLLERITQLESAEETATAEAKRLETLASAAIASRAQLVAALPPQRKERDRLKQQLESLEQRIQQTQDTNADLIAGNRNLWTLTIAGIAFLVVMMLCLLWRLWVLHRIIEPLQKMEKVLQAVRSQHEELSQRAIAITSNAEAGPQSVDEAIEKETKRRQEAIQREQVAHHAAEQTRQEIANAKQQVQSEQQEARQLRASAEQERAESIRNATKIEFRVPLLRKTSKSPETFECYRNSIARLTHHDKIDENYFEIDTVKSSAITKLAKQPVIVMDRKREGESATDLGNVASPLSSQLKSIPTSDHFLFALVRPSGFDAFRKLRAQAWKRDLEVGWQPLQEDLPIVCGGGEGGDGPGVQ